MKTGCLLLLGLWISLSITYYYLFQSTQFASLYWLPIVLSLSVVISVANFQGIWLALSQRKASKKSPHEWRDGELVGVSGRVQALRTPIIAPFSGKPSVIVEYDIKRIRTNSDGTSTTTAFMGMLMTPCAVYTQRGPIKLVGFPLITQIPAENIAGDENFRRAAKYLVTTKFQDKPKNPLTLLKELNKVLNDEDGDLRVDFKIPGALALNLDSEVEMEDEEEPATKLQDQSKIENDVLVQLKNSGYSLNETLVPNGTELTVFGSYRAAKQAIDIGSGLKNLRHQIHLGAIDQTLTKQFIKTIFATLFFGAVSFAAHWYVAKELGYPVESLVDRLKF